VGNGQAGVNAAVGLRDCGYDGAIIMFGDEETWPYDRPPLSKQILEANAEPENIISKPDAAAKSIEIRCAMSVVGIDRINRSIELSDGKSIAYDALVLATGGSARELPTLPSDNRRVFTLRTIHDARKLSTALLRVENLAILGGGWLGLEVAAAAREVGKSVVLLETAPRICARSLPAEVALALHHIHVERGIQIEAGASASVTHDGQGIRIKLNGRAPECFSLAVVSIGLEPRDHLARAAGILCDNGILTDGCGRTNDPDIFAVGDVARLHHDALGHRLRLESWRNAVTQGRLAAQAICGMPAHYHEAPWFWSEQFGHLIQIAGLPDPSLKMISHEDGPRPLWRYGDADQVKCVIGIDRAKDIKQAHRSLSVHPDAAQRSA
jgi:3-phenylpropionate/trans-cinnamate dioxygenase ferredoxin reductase subunit